MTRRVVAAFLFLLAVLLVLARIAPPTRSDQPAAATAVPAGEFKEVQPCSRFYVVSGTGSIRPTVSSADATILAACSGAGGTPTAAAGPAHSPDTLTRTTNSPNPSPTPVASQPVTGNSPAPSLRPRVAAVREAPSSHSASVTGQSAIGTALVAGIASTYGPGFDGYLALPAGRGIHVRICGAGGCIDRVSNDAGPVPSLHRVADLDVSDFEYVCAAPWTRGLCRVSVEVLAP